MAKRSRAVELKVSWHPGGSRTLMQSVNGATHKDLKGPFFCNSDAAEFYRAVAKKIAKMAKRGDRVTFKDTDASH